MKKHFVYILVSVVALAVMLMASRVQAGEETDSISIKFGANEPDSRLAADAVAGIPGVQSANWNNATDGMGTLNNLVRDIESEATMTTASVTWATSNTWRSGSNNQFAGANKTLMNGYLDQNTEPRVIQIRISNVPYALYDVYVYFLGDGQHRGGVYTVNGTAQFGFVTARSTGPSFVDAGETAPPAIGNYLVFPGLTGGTVTITADNDIGFRAPINAVQIVSSF